MNVALAPSRGVWVTVGVNVGKRVKVGGNVAVAVSGRMGVHVAGGAEVPWSGARINKTAPTQ